MAYSLIKSLAVSAVFLTATPVTFADPESDARYIVDATLTREYLTVVMGAMADMMSGSMTAELARNGVTVSAEASDTIVNMMMTPMVDLMLEGMGDDLVQVFVTEMTPESLRAYRAFLETPAGREVISTMPAISAASAEVGERLGLSMGAHAANEMMANIRSGNFPDGTSDAVKAELSALFP